VPVLGGDSADAGIDFLQLREQLGEPKLGDRARPAELQDLRH
jgi:hypothetical protein